MEGQRLLQSGTDQQLPDGAARAYGTAKGPHPNKHGKRPLDLGKRVEFPDRRDNVRIGRARDPNEIFAIGIIEAEAAYDDTANQVDRLLPRSLCLAALEQHLEHASHDNQRGIILSAKRPERIDQRAWKVIRRTRGDGMPPARDPSRRRRRPWPRTSDQTRGSECDRGPDGEHLAPHKRSG